MAANVNYLFSFTFLGDLSLRQNLACLDPLLIDNDIVKFVFV